jgi:predicted MPP superfamily phosphohydrolase
MPSPSRRSPDHPPRLPAHLRRFLLIILPIVAALHAYLGWRLLPALPLGPLATGLAVLLLAGSTLLIPLGLLARFLRLRESDADRLSALSAVLMGLFSSLLVLTLLRDLALLFIAAPAFRSASAIGVIVLALALTAIGFVNARRTARVLRVDVPLAGLPSALHGFTIAQISDIHVGPTIKHAYVRAIVERVNGLDADLIAITGDVVDGGVDHLGAHTRPLADLRARHGAFVVTGNHEYYSGAAEWQDEFARLGLRVLCNEHVLIEHAGARLVLAGVTDYSAHAFDPAQRSDPHAAQADAPDGLPKILLAHQPRSARAAEAAGYDLQLSGHTHGGQFWPWNLFVTLQQPYTAGLHRHGRMWVYTSRGTGYWGPPKRFGAPSEITLLRLVAEGAG